MLSNSTYVTNLFVFVENNFNLKLPMAFLGVLKLVFNELSLCIIAWSCLLHKLFMTWNCLLHETVHNTKMFIPWNCPLHETAHYMRLSNTWSFRFPFWPQYVRQIKWMASSTPVMLCTSLGYKCRTIKETEWVLWL